MIIRLFSLADIEFEVDRRDDSNKRTNNATFCMSTPLRNIYMILADELGQPKINLDRSKCCPETSS